MTAAREYLRVSRDESGRLRSVDEQHADNRRDAEANGWDLGLAYGESNAVSASRFGTHRRGGFERLITDLETGRFGAEILILWEPRRGSRKVSEWARLIELCEAAGVQIYVTSHRKLYDMHDPRDRRTMHYEAADAEYDGAQKSEATRRAIDANAANGKPHGAIPYGYRRRYDVTSGGKRILVAQEPDPVEAPVVRELYARLRQGHSLRAIADDFEARGMRTRSGKVFRASHLGEIALRPIYGGLRVHAPGTRHRDLSGAVKATWPPLVDEQTFYGVRSLLTSPERRTSRPGRGKHLLSMIAVCDRCGSPVSTTYRYGTRQYECRNGGHVRVGADDLDAYAERVMLAYLERPDVGERLRRAMSDGDDAELMQVRGDLAAARSELTDLRLAVGDGRLSVASLVAAEPQLMRRVSELEDRERELSTPPVLAGLAGPDISARWEHAPMSAKREIARMLLSPPVLGQLRVTRAGGSNGGQRVTPAAERVKWGTS
jgi:site-specific DNA recombinase